MELWESLPERDIRACKDSLGRLKRTLGECSKMITLVAKEHGCRKAKQQWERPLRGQSKVGADSLTILDEANNIANQVMSQSRVHSGKGQSTNRPCGQQQNLTVSVGLREGWCLCRLGVEGSVNSKTFRIFRAYGKEIRNSIFKNGNRYLRSVHFELPQKRCRTPRCGRRCPFAVHSNLRRKPQLHQLDLRQVRTLAATSQSLPQRTRTRRVHNCLRNTIYILA